VKSLIAFCLLLTACCPQLKPGDCVMSGDYKIYQILEVGSKGAYMVRNKQGEIINWHALMGGFTSTDCFNDFKDLERIKP